ncbi:MULTISPECIES: PDZ domain-containing protein [Aneurinibacillus]|uniref:PDZ domain-containing protein n=1 Tax=Aneurinibacillus thermoaerophilus TaxID=143495 RepID=A0A1G8EAT5_ANETH|nr:MULTISPECIES: PDZ domain-containing protein [Aneurinibacillus]AMA71767.1 hypothetical protein ACH33_02200 [Aneurinibacillus sp. XH2]MED0676893.1 PDZ domain-containing protein [Aneurinibacillus thermoaerophilus]MED0680748.1 PDZ domain-containing protein [Aneurinibacillus thermoaerophilus]MED0738771.1 PDZ domain-containing protein [Aneurinibacillus thermoaerophilus]MED0758010.1 PDZ domain-containing protein [Aneurinibacillus thermoaerophilus]
MGDWSGFLLDVLIQIPKFLLSPALYIFALLLFWHYHKQVVQERKLFHVRLTSAPGELLRSLLLGALAGVGVSALLLLFGIALSYYDVVLLWGISILFALINIRFLSFAYSGGFLAIVSVLARLVPPDGADGWLGQLLLWLRAVNIPGVLALVALLHIAEGLLVQLTPKQGFSPVLIKSQRGRVVGAYVIQKYWMIPAVLFVSGVPGGTYAIDASGWWPLFYAGAAALSLLPIPTVIGYADLAVLSTPQEKAKQAGRRIMLFGILLFVLAWAGVYWLPVAVFGGLLSLLGHEAFRIYGKWQRRLYTPLYVQLKKGVRVLAVVPGSPADEMEIITGDVILRINGREINNKAAIYLALQRQSAFCKMEVMNREGHIKYVQRSVYQGDHHQLGLILAPDVETDEYVEQGGYNRLFGLFRKVRTRRNNESYEVPFEQGKDVTL